MRVPVSLSTSSLAFGTLVLWLGVIVVGVQGVVCLRLALHFFEDTLDE